MALRLSRCGSKVLKKNLKLQHLVEFSIHDLRRRPTFTCTRTQKSQMGFKSNIAKLAVMLRTSHPCDAIFHCIHCIKAKRGVLNSIHYLSRLYDVVPCSGCLHFDVTKRSTAATTSITSLKLKLEWKEEIKKKTSSCSR